MISNLKDLKNSTNKLLDLINTFWQVAGYKINIQKYQLFNTLTMNRLRNKSGKPFAVTSKIIKYSGVVGSCL
jgi:hypothetical protein